MRNGATGVVHSGLGAALSKFAGTSSRRHNQRLIITPPGYQSTTLSATNRTPTTLPQNRGSWNHREASAVGNADTPITSPSSSLAGRGLVARLTNTVTPTHIIQAQSARYKFSDMACASGESPT